MTLICSLPNDFSFTRIATLEPLRQDPTGATGHPMTSVVLVEELVLVEVVDGLLVEVLEEVVGRLVDVDVELEVEEDVLDDVLLEVEDEVDVVVGRVVDVDVVVGRGTVTVVVVGTGTVDVVVVEVVVVVLGQLTPQHGRNGSWTISGGGVTVPVTTGTLVR